MQNKLEPKEQAGDLIAGFFLTPPQRWLSFATGIAIVGFSAYSLFTERAVPAIIVFLLLGGGCLATAAVGRIGRITVEGGGAKLSIEPSDGNNQNRAESTSAPPTALDAGQEQDEKSDAREQVAEAAGEAASPSPFGQAVDAYFDKDYQVFEEKMNDWIAAEEDEDKKLSMQALKLLWLFEAGQGHRLNELVKLRGEQPDSPGVVMRLGDAYGSSGDNERAAAIYAEGQEIESIGEDDVVRLLGRQSQALRRMKSLSDAKIVLHDGLKKAKEIDNVAALHQHLADVYRDEGNSIARQWHLEKVLEFAPGDGDARFNLAYSYDEAGLPLASFYHYDILVGQRNDAAELNNQGVLFAQLDMPILAAKRYKRAIQQNHTLAAANLAATMRDAGLVEEARSILGEALKADDVDEMVHRIASSVSQEDTKEDERVKSVREGAASEREFARKRFEVEGAVSHEITTDVAQGSWDTTLGEMTFRENEGRLITSFRRAPYWDWSLDGELSGRVYDFKWECDNPNENQRGEGLLLFTSDTNFEGLIRHTPRKGEVQTFSGTKRASG